ncbi:MAG: hypothetical protein WBA76_00200 [Phormidesmis sp.]
MISNSRLVAQNNAFGLEVAPSTRVADTYSDSLMDDLFLEVDQILEGDLSSYMTMVRHQPRPINPSSRTVQLPENFAPKSAADIYRATVATMATVATVAAVEGSDRTNPYTPQYPVLQAAKQAAPSTKQSANHHGYRHGGRPVTTAAHRSLARSLASAGNFQATVIQSPIQSPDADLYSNSAGAQASPPQTGSHYLYPNEPYPDGAAPALTLFNPSPRPPQTIFEPQVQPYSQVSLPLLLIGAASISAVSTVGLWALSQSAPGNGWLLSLGQEATAAEIPDNSTADFLVYLQRSLEVITARQAGIQQTVAVIPVANKVPTLPTTVPNINPSPSLGALPNLPGAAATPNVIERVFVPVYQSGSAAQPSAKARTTLPALPSVAMPNRKAQRPTVPVPAPVAAAAAIPPGAPATARPSVPIVNAGTNALPAPSVPVAVAPTNAAAAITNIKPNSEHVLVGILNLGSRSAALFNVDGNSQRAYVGDRVGVSEWSLVSVNGQDVVVRRNGEVRSVYIGQRF